MSSTLQSPAVKRENLEDKHEFPLRSIEVKMDTFMQAVKRTAMNPSPNVQQVTYRREELKAMAEGIQKTRNSAKNFSSLLKLTIAYIIENRSAFVPDPSAIFFCTKINPFRNVPDKVLKSLLPAVVDASDVPSTEKLCLLMCLLNRNTLEFESLSRLEISEIRDSESTIFRHMLQNCPAIEQASVTQAVLKNFSVVPRMRREDIFPLMAAKWRKLKVLHVDISCFGNVRDEFASCPQQEHPLKMICDSLPILSDLDVTIQPDHMTLLEARCFERMRHLKNLSLTFAGDIDMKICKIVVHLVGKTPNLREFNLDVNRDYLKIDVSPVYGDIVRRYDLDSLFVELYAELYPAKTLLLRNCWVDVSRVGIWPAILSVRHLRVMGKVFNLNIAALPYEVSALSTEYMPLPIVYALLHLLGANLSSLTVRVMDCFYGAEPEEIDIFAVISACPALKHLRLNTPGTVAGHSAYRLAPGQFKKLETFSIDSNVYEKIDPRFSQLFKKFFLESQTRNKSHCVESACELRAMHWALKEPSAGTCLDELEELKLKKIPFGLGQADILPVIGYLVERSPFLKKVNVFRQIHAFSPPKWFECVLKSVGVTMEYSADTRSDDCIF
ncbi:uncharacterized protein LOC135934782 [Cloeon dipterum]|uniref:uncharacterized protein LOC135934782 n=1 Tax=Cloeon dipterum TaxID=197152 RepID=UPI0032202E66